MAIDVADVASVASTDTASASPDALSTEPTDGGATVESPIGETTTDASLPTPESDDDSAEAGDETEASTNEDGTPRPSRSERQRQKWLEELLSDPAKAESVLGPAIQPFVDKALSAKEQQAQAEATTRQQQETAQRAAQARSAAFAEHLGVPDAPGKPGTLSQFQQEYDEANRQVRSELVNPTGADLDALIAKAANAEAQIGRLRANNALVSAAEDYIWEQINQGGFARVGEIPEMAANPEAVKRFLHGGHDVHQAHQILADTIRSSEQAKSTQALAALEAKHATQMKAVEADRNAWRVRAGGGEATTANGGTASLGSGGSVVQRLIREAGSPEAYAERAMRGDYAGIDLTR